MADEKYIDQKFKDGYYPITRQQMQNNRFKNFTGDKKFGSREDLNKYHSDLIEKLNKKKVRPSEIAKLDKEFKSRMKEANDDVQYRLSVRPGMAKERRKQKGTIPDTGSAFAKGGRAGYKDGKSVEKKGLSSRTKGSNRPSKELDFSKKNFSYSGKEMQDDKKARKSRTQSQSRMNPVPYKSGGRTGYSVGGRAMRGVSKILMKK